MTFPGNGVIGASFPDAFKCGFNLASFQAQGVKNRDYFDPSVIVLHQHAKLMKVMLIPR
jgi:hypothetical protein